MEKKSPLKKNPCPDCTFCQYCSETRCSLCRSVECRKDKKACTQKIHKPLFRAY